MILLERQGSDCLGAAEIDEQSHGMVKLPFLNKSNQMLLTSQQVKSGSIAHKQPKFGNSLKNDDEDRENQHGMISEAAAFGQSNAPLSARTPRQPQ